MMKPLLKLIFMRVYHNELVAIAKEAKSDKIMLDGRQLSVPTNAGYRLGLLAALEKLNLLAD